MIFNSEINVAIGIAILYILIFAVAEAWRYFYNPKTETTRKFVHIAGGFIALSFGFLFHSHWIVLLLCLGFGLFIYFTRKISWLGSVHDIKRQSTGGIYYPIAIYLTFLYSTIINEPVFYFIAILVLAVSDSTAALIGSSYGIKFYRVEEDKKTLEGSIIFFLTTFMIVHLCLLLMTDIGRIECTLAALYLSILVTSFEAISLGGADNLIIPVGTLYILSKITTKPVSEIEFQLLLILSVFILVLIIILPTKKIGLSGIIGISLLSYGACALINIEWFLPIVISLLLLFHTDIFIGKPVHIKNKYMIRSVFYIVLVPLLWILLANLDIKDKYYYYVPFTIAILAHLVIMWEGRLREFKENNKKSKPIPYLNIHFSLRALILIAIFYPIFIILNVQLNIIYSIIVFYIAIILSDRLFWFAEDHMYIKTEFIDLLKIRTLIILIISTLSLILIKTFM